jgi:RNA polymerase sigma-70 factor (ECF subfamily)
VERLPFEQKQVFLLREEAGLSFKEIAEMTGCPLNTALGRMHYAMESLRKSLKAYGMQ